MTPCHNASLAGRRFIYCIVFICIHSSHTTTSWPSKLSRQAPEPAESTTKIVSELFSKWRPDLNFKNLANLWHKFKKLRLLGNLQARLLITKKVKCVGFVEVQFCYSSGKFYSMFNLFFLRMSGLRYWRFVFVPTEINCDLVVAWKIKNGRNLPSSMEVPKCLKIGVKLGFLHGKMYPCLAVKCPTGTAIK